MADPVAVAAFSFLEQVFALIIGTLFTALGGWVYHINNRVVQLETERIQLENLKELMAAKYESLEKLINSKFDTLLLLIQADIARASDDRSNRSPDRARGWREGD